MQSSRYVKAQFYLFSINVILSWNNFTSDGRENIADRNLDDVDNRRWNSQNNRQCVLFYPMGSIGLKAVFARYYWWWRTQNHLRRLRRSASPGAIFVCACRFVALSPFSLGKLSSISRTSLGSEPELWSDSGPGSCSGSPTTKLTGASDIS